MKKNNGNKIITLSFLSILMLVSIISIMTPERSFSATENRYLQKKPNFTMKALMDGSYGTKYESYLSDQFPGRNGWIGIKVMAERVQGKRDVNGVYFGKKDYLIEKFEAEDIEGEVLDKNLERLEGFVNMANDQLGEDQVRVMLVPTASQILTDKLPYLAAPYDQNYVTEMVTDAVGTGNMVFIEDVLMRHNQEALYYKTDHHWTVLGAYYGYEAWANSLGFKSWSQDEFDIQTVSKEFLGTVYSKVNVPHEPDTIQLYLPKSQMEYTIYYDDAKVPADMYTYSALEGKDKYSIYMDGNHGLTEVRNPDEGLDETRKLLIIKDSFAHSLAPFAVNHFAETYMIDLRYFNQSPKAFMEEKGITDLLILYQIPGFAQEKTVSKLEW